MAGASPHTQLPTHFPVAPVTWGWGTRGEGLLRAGGNRSPLSPPQRCRQQSPARNTRTSAAAGAASANRTRSATGSGTARTARTRTTAVSAPGKGAAGLWASERNTAAWWREPLGFPTWKQPGCALRHSGGVGGVQEGSRRSRRGLSARLGTWSVNILAN